MAALLDSGGGPQHASPVVPPSSRAPTTTTAGHPLSLVYLSEAGQPCNISTQHTAKEKAEEDRGRKKGAREEQPHRHGAQEEEQASKASSEPFDGWKWKAFLLAFAPAAFGGWFVWWFAARHPRFEEGILLASCCCCCCRVPGRQCLFLLPAAFFFPFCVR